MERSSFDVVCKELVKNLGEHLVYDVETQFFIDPQYEIESSLGYVEKRNARRESVDVVWQKQLRDIGLKPLWKRLFSDVIVAWEIDAVNSTKVIQASIENLERLNPRLGIEFLLVGTNEKAIKNFDTRFKKALFEAKSKKTRIIVIHDIHFAMMYCYITGRHPEKLYEEYLNKCRSQPKIANRLKKQLEELINTSKPEADFKQEFYEKFINRIS